MYYIPSESKAHRKWRQFLIRSTMIEFVFLLKGPMRQRRRNVDNLGFTAASIPCFLLHGARTEFGQWYCIPSYRSNETVYMLGIRWIVPMEPQSATNLGTNRWSIDGDRKWKHQSMALWTTNQITNQCNLSRKKCVLIYNFGNIFFFLSSAGQTFGRNR